ncbi:MAG: ABC transporter substrate-binding protein, partial [Ignavibacteria bacterium]
MMYLNKIILIITAVFFSLSCSEKGNRDADSVIYWSSNNTEEIEFARQAVNLWNKKNPERMVSFQPVPEGQSSEEIILAAVVGKTTPDIYSNMWQGDVESYADAG